MTKEREFADVIKVRKETAKVLTELVSYRDKLTPSHPRKAQYRAVAKQVERALVSLDNALEKAGLK